MSRMLIAFVLTLFVSATSSLSQGIGRFCQQRAQPRGSPTMGSGKHGMKRRMGVEAPTVSVLRREKSCSISEEPSSGITRH